MRKSTVILCGGLLLFSLASLWLLKLLDDAHVRNEELLAQVAALEQAPRINVPPQRSEATVVEDAPARPIVITMAARPEAARAQTKPVSAAEFQEREKRALAHAPYRDALKEQRRLELREWRNDIVRLLGLTPERADQVIDIYIEQSIRESIQPNPRNAEEFAQRWRAIQESTRNPNPAVAAIIGEVKAMEWQQYVASQPARFEARQLRSQLTSTSAPLREDQFEPLVAALSAESARLTQELNDYRVSLNWDEANTEISNEQYARYATEHVAAYEARTHAAVASLLSPAQLAAFEAMRSQRAEMQHAQKQIMRTRIEANSTGSPASQPRPRPHPPQR